MMRMGGIFRNRIEDIAYFVSFVTLCSQTALQSKLFYARLHLILESGILCKANKHNERKMEMKYELAIFDMDGTILDTLEDLKDTLNYALSKNHYPEHSLDDVRRFVGNGIPKLIERGVPKGTDAESIVRVHKDFMDYYKVHCADKTKPYAGIEELIAELRNAGCKTAVVSNKADVAVQELCKQYFEGLFDYAVGDREGIRKKPAPDSVNEVLNYLKVERSNAVYIGDSEVDIATADNSGLDSIIVSWGFREVPFLKEQGAKVIVDKPEKVAELILEKG